MFFVYFPMIEVLLWIERTSFASEKILFASSVSLLEYSDAAATTYKLSCALIFFIARTS
jgi:hypothetical protein